MRNTIDNSIFWTGKYQEYSNLDALASVPTRITLNTSKPILESASLAQQIQPLNTFTPTKKQLACANKVGLSVSWIDPKFRAVARPDAEGAEKLKAFDACMAAVEATIGIEPVTEELLTNTGPIITNDFPTTYGGGGSFAPAPAQEEVIAPAPKKEKTIFGIKPMYFFGGLAALALTVAVIK